MSTAIISIVSGISGMFGWGVYDFLGSVYTKQIGPFKSFFWSQLAGLVATFVLIFVFPFRLNASLLVMILLPIAAIIYAAGYLLFFKGFEKGNVSIVAATMNLWAVFTMLFAFLFAGQRLSTMQLTGAVLIIVGVTLASLNWGAVGDQRIGLSAGVRETVLGAFLFGVFWNVDEVISEQIGWVSATLLVKLGIVLFLLVFSLLTRRELVLAQSPASTKYAVVVMGIIEAGAIAAVNYGLTIGDAILITPISSALSLVTILLAIVFLKEKVTRLQVFGIVTAVGGIVVTAF